MRKLNRFVVFIFFIFLFFLLFIDSSIYFVRTSKVIRSKDGNILRIFLSEDEQYVLPGQIYKKYPENLVKCVLIKEDRRFFYHPGFDILSIFRAFIGNISGKKRSGASTITMQLARMRGNRKRTYLNKLKEIIEALKIEICHSKEEILKAYLDQAPYGMNIRGVGTASEMFFSKDINKLTWAQYATLSVLPNNPSYVNVSMHRERLREKRDRVLERLFEKKIITRTDLILSKAENIPRFNKRLPFLAPHLCSRLRLNLDEDVIDTTIDFNLQKRAENICKNELNNLKQKAINNLSVVIIDNSDNEIITYIGNPLYFDRTNQSMVDGVVAARSTGSILKPFLYALSIDQGIIVPDSLLLDIPTFYGSYSPENYNNHYNGPITAKNALISSLNVPAVRLLEKYSVNAFYDFLKKAGMTTLFRDADDYGLSLIIGGAEGNLIEITQMYSGLSEKGNIFKAKVIKNEEVYKFGKLISSGACEMIKDCIKELSRPGLDGVYKEFTSSKEISWKTGTSYGSRDAWSIGTDGKITIGVWTGNFDGSSSPHLTGAQASAPIMFRLFSMIDHKNSVKEDLQEKNKKIYKKINICSISGYRATIECNETRVVDVPEDSKLLKACPFHESVAYDKDLDRVVCSGCWDDKKYEIRSFLSFPPQAYPYLSSDIKRRLLPKHKEGCNESVKKSSVKIVYPTHGSLLSHQRKEKILLKLTKDKMDKIVFIFINKSLFKKSDDVSFFFTPLKGDNLIEVISEDGYIDRVKLIVTLI